MTTRRCVACKEAKTIRGVWYLLPPLSGAGGFVCETCWTHRPAAVPSARA